ncbi:MAG: S8 family serine peptidase, partial [Cyclobacteriaceae bacterium]|nr:S8 family serine peptidase [Cyclobacteriaceae bacterium]
MMVKKHIVILLVFFSVGLFGQDNKGTGKNVIPENWYNLDIETDGVAGVSVDRAYELLKKKKSTRVIVAVLDNGVQTDHEDLIGKIWLNEDEIPGNNRDDDNNGYEDDMHGWNFIGGKSGDVKEDTHELTRVYLSLKEKYGVLKRREVRKENWEEFDYWEKIKENFEKTLGEAEEKYNFYSNLKFSVGLYDSLFCIMLGVDSLTKEDLERVEVKDTNFKQGKSILQFVLNATKNELTIKEIIHDLKEMEKYYKDQLDFTYNVRFNPREIVGDNYSDINERYYGNNHVAGPSPEHGTHVAGIIAANRDNGLGIRGI